MNVFIFGNDQWLLKNSCSHSAGETCAFQFLGSLSQRNLATGKQVEFIHELCIYQQYTVVMIRDRSSSERPRKQTLHRIYPPRVPKPDADFLAVGQHRLADFFKVGTGASVNFRLVIEPYRCFWEPDISLGFSSIKRLPAVESAFVITPRMPGAESGRTFTESTVPTVSTELTETVFSVEAHAESDASTNATAISIRGTKIRFIFSDHPWNVIEIIKRCGASG